MSSPTEVYGFMSLDDATVNDVTSPVSDRVRLRRGASRGVYAPEVIRSILDDGVIAHVAVSTDLGPLVLPMAYGHDGELLYLHGSTANALLRSARGGEVCVTVTLLDGLIVGRSVFHNSANYRSVVIRATPHEVSDASDKLRALRLISDQVIPTWATGRSPTPEELRRTLVIGVPIEEASAKVRTGGPADEPSDLAGTHWGGRVPIHTYFGTPEAAEDLALDVNIPPAIARLDGTPLRSR